MSGYNEGYNACSGDGGIISGGDSSSINNKSKFRVTVIFIEGPDRLINPIDAFYNDDPYTSIWEDEITMSSDLIDMGEEFHIRRGDTKKGYHKIYKE